MEPCNHTSVGILVRNGNKILFIERKKFPFGFALPAGHVDDGEKFYDAAKRELEEEVGLKAKSQILIGKARKNNPCRRIVGDNYHDWEIYEIEVTGDLKRSESETKRAVWLDIDKIKELTERTKKYMVGNVPEDEWQKSPGLEPAWLEWLYGLKII